MTTDYPEHEKMKKVQEASHAIGQFVEWLASGEAHEDDKPIVLAYYSEARSRYDDDVLEQMPYTIEKLLARYFGIDLELIAAEKDAMIADLREAQRRLFDPTLADNTPTDAAIKEAKESK